MTMLKMKSLSQTHKKIHMGFHKMMEKLLLVWCDEWDRYHRCDKHYKTPCYNKNSGTTAVVFRTMKTIVKKPKRNCVPPFNQINGKLNKKVTWNCLPARSSDSTSFSFRQNITQHTIFLVRMFAWPFLKFNFSVSWLFYSTQSSLVNFKRSWWGLACVPRGLGVNNNGCLHADTHFQALKWKSWLK